MDDYADLELGLRRSGPTTYQVEFRYSLPNSDADIRLGQETPVEAVLDLKKLQELSYDWAAYSTELTSALFGSEQLRLAFAQARATASAQSLRLRLRIFVGPSAPDLHNLHWELLRDPQDGSALATSENILFSRYLSSVDWRPIRLKSKGELCALIVVASPTNLADYHFSPIDAEAEIQRAKDGLEGLLVSVLPSSGRRATLNGILNALRAESADILYLVSHGLIVNEQPILILENEDGKAERVSGHELVTRLIELESQPRLAVLVSCQSGGKSEGDALGALGPRLAEAGIPAVLAMQDNISMDTAARFLPEFFGELQRDGQIDRAVSVARGTVRERPDAWVPVLTTRLKSGRLWYTPGFGESGKGFEKFPAILQSVRRSHCTPIVGGGLTEPLFGSLREVARRWAEQFHYPMMPHERESLSQVTQYLTVQQSPQFPYDELEEYLKDHILGRLEKEAAWDQLREPPGLDQLIKVLGAEQRARDPNEPHKLLAELPLPVFITVNADALLEDALREAGKSPESMLCPWNEYIEQEQSIFERDPEYVPSPERPLVFHLFGRWSEPESVVLTEDNYFDFLIGVTSKRKLIPELVRQLLSDSSLLFLGFQMEEWNFRVLYRSILSQEGRSRRRRYTHIAAQIEPDDDRILEPARARRYLEQYFGGADISIYWGRPNEFLGELLQQWRREMQHDSR